jgi:hypothetical protein
MENSKVIGAKVQAFKEKEFLVAMGIIIATAGYNCRGCELWAADDPDIPVCQDINSWCSIIQLLTFGKYMGENRFKEYHKLNPSIWEEKDAKDSDPWWDLSQAVEEFNQQSREETKQQCGRWKMSQCQHGIR